MSLHSPAGSPPIQRSWLLQQSGIGQALSFTNYIDINMTKIESQQKSLIKFQNQKSAIKLSYDLQVRACNQSLVLQLITNTRSNVPI